MTLDYRPGGRRRLDHVLDPAFSDDLSSLDDQVLRARRDDAQQEEADLSYVRRLLQGRLDLLDAERAHRSGELPAPGRGAARSDAELAQALSRILADETRTTRGIGRFLSVEPSRIGEHRREAELAVADVRTSAPGELSDAELTEIIDHLRGIEQRLSTTRRRVQQVESQLTEELGRRLRVG
ncbi:hypothetical protein SAMN06264364_12033 [Quadrisphaera granulorum]|uniref:RsiG-like domain-containing protein n=1 Tax=Quadrisphaera granulorum TaxID=317664 RepID=A0A316A287_9ACTN|nr:aerial mycelium formation protein [Quadrisphaera granulorum]PWJ51755.1 hypothetical protein BXY45_12033 [Quadrisphaera granulorum]SZE97702.1 hypothetical protein SAMN06264364_12033 [Quadrisphaera granulorum]